MKLFNFIKIILPCLFLLGSTPTSHAQQVGPDITILASMSDAPVGFETSIYLAVKDFENVISAQFSMHYNTDALNLIDVETLADDFDFDFGFPNPANNLEPGTVTTTWVSTGLDPVTLDDFTQVIKLNFIRINDGEPDFIINNNPTPIEVVYFDDLIGGIISAPFTYGDITGAFVTGNIYQDLDDNCIYSDNENSLGNVRIRAESGDLFSSEVFSDAEGNYTLLLYGSDYQISVLPSTEAWAACPPVSLTVESGEEYNLNLGMQGVIDCEAMSVSIGTNTITRCFSTTYQVQYCNIGTLPVDLAEIQIDLDESLFYESSSIPTASSSDNILQYEIQNIASGQCGSFVIEAGVGCDDDGVELGQTHCTTAAITPYDCFTPSPIWDGSSLDITGECINNEVVFTITNMGDDMTTPSEFIIIEDEIIMMQEPIQLPAGGSIIKTYTPNGSTYRAVLEQSEGHPGESMPTEAVEGCGTNPNGEISLGFVTQFPENDADLNISIFCLENEGSYDPNDKQGFPRGALDENYIEANTDIEYMIRFQNTGTGPAFNVVIRDTLSEHLDVTSLELGARSHDYVLDIKYGRYLEFRFEDIMLPDSASDMNGSNGYLLFKIAQQADLPLETRIENTASIYFDFNDPVVTNTVFHTIGKDFLDVILATDEENIEPIGLNVAPNPINETATFSLENYEAKQGVFTLYDMRGQIIRIQTFTGEGFNFERKNIPAGAYFFEISDETMSLNRGKLILK